MMMKTILVKQFEDASKWSLHDLAIKTADKTKITSFNDNRWNIQSSTNIV